MRGVLGVFIFLLIATSARAHTITSVKNLLDKHPVETFDYRDKVYIYIVWDKLNKGEHTVEAHWFNPRDKQQEFISYKIIQVTNEHFKTVNFIVQC